MLDNFDIIRFYYYQTLVFKEERESHQCFSIVLNYYLEQRVIRDQKILLSLQPTRMTATLMENIVLVMDVARMTKSQLSAGQLLARVFRLIRAHVACNDSQYKHS